MTTSDDLKPAPLTHCENVYTVMREEAKEVREGDVPMIVWEGFLTRLVRKLELSVPYYSTIRGHLIDMGCMRQLRRGGGTTPSQWELIRPPTMGLWQQLPEKPSARAVASTSSGAVEAAELAALRQQIRDITEKVASLERNQTMLVELYNENLQKKGA